MAGEVRLNPDNRKALILSAAVTVANRGGITAATWEAVAAACEVPTAAETVRHYFANRSALWRAIASDPRANERVRYRAREMGFA